jgi:O-acetyl-ADP-ribose deacetylase (regulator of RNase III)
MATVEVVRGNIVEITADVVVNAANKGLTEGGGVCGHIFGAAGRTELWEACRSLGGCPTGQAKSTSSFGLAKNGVRWIIHAVGPRWPDHSPEDADALLESAYRSALAEAEKLNVSSIAFPTIGTGIFKFPKERAADIAVGVCRTHLGNLDKILLLAIDEENDRILRTAMAKS